MLGAWSPLQIGNDIAFCLALNADVRVWDGPGAGGAIVLELSVLHRSVVTLTGIVQQNPVASIFSYGKAESIAGPLGGNFCALSIAEITEIL